MKHYINTNKELFGIEQGQEFLVQSDLVEVSLEEIEAINKAKEDEYKNSIEYKINEAKQYLLSTDYKMTIDYFATMSAEQQEEVTRLRSEARELVRENEK